MPSNKAARARNLPPRGHLEGFDLSDLALKQVPVLPDPIPLIVRDAEAADAAALTCWALHLESAERASILARSLEEVRHHQVQLIGPLDLLPVPIDGVLVLGNNARSEERRVGKEGRSRWS